MSHIQRVTPLRIVEDLEDESLFYEAMGGERVSTSSPDSITYRAANDADVRISSYRSVLASYGPFVANMLAKEGALYMQVSDIDAHVQSIPEAKIIARTNVHGTDEAVVDTDGNLVVLAKANEIARGR